MAELWSPATKNAARQWLNTHQAYFVHSGTTRIGIKQTIQVIDPIDGSTVDKDVPVEEFGFWGATEPNPDPELDPIPIETWRRSFNEIQQDFVDVEEVIFAIVIWGRETGNPTDYFDDAEAVIREDLLLFLTANNINTIGHSTRTDAEVEAYVVANTP
jgi:hypothetical protein